MKKYLVPVTFLVLLLAYMNTYAQSSGSSTKKYVFHLSVADEYSWLSFSSLNDELSGHGLPTIKRPDFGQISLRLLPDSFSNRLFLGFQFESAQTKKSDVDYLTKLTFYVLNINFFYTVWYSRRSIIYPGLGVGLMQDNLLLQNKSKTPSSFGEALTDFQGSQRMMTDNFSLNPSINYTWAMDRERDFLLNVFAGYRIALNRAPLKLETGESLNGAPETSAGGFFVGAGIGL